MIVEFLLLLAIAIALGVALGCGVYLWVYRHDAEPPSLLDLVRRSEIR